MTKRERGHLPYQEHPTHPYMPDVPGHKQKGSGKTVNKEIKRELLAQIERLRKEILDKTDSEDEILPFHSSNLN